jgi:hypothetical protein
MSELAPYERATYVHCLFGGPHDGERHPAGHCYSMLSMSGDLYRQVSEPVPMEQPPGLHVLNCTDDYMEPVFYRVEMKYEGT